MSNGHIDLNRRNLSRRPGSSSYLTDQALRRLRYLHTSIATQNWGECRIKDTSWTGNERSLLHQPCSTSQHIAISLGPVKEHVSNRDWCVSTPLATRVTTPRETRVTTPRETRVTTPRETRVTSSRDRQNLGRKSEERISGNQWATLGTGATSCLNYDIGNRRDRRDNGGCMMMVPHGAFLPRRRILTQNIAQRRCKWTENMESNYDDLQLVQDNHVCHTPREQSTMLPSIVDHPTVRQTLEVKHVRLKTPPPSPSIRHISVHLPAS